MNYDPEDPWKEIEPVEPRKLEPKWLKEKQPKPTCTPPKPIEAGETESARIYREAQEELQARGNINWFPVILKTVVLIIRTTMDSKTTWLTVLQVATGILSMVLAGFGFNETNNTLTVNSPWWAWGGLALYAALKIVKGKLTADAKP